VVAEQVGLAVFKDVVLVAPEHAVRPVGPARFLAVPVSHDLSDVVVQVVDALHELVVHTSSRLDQLEVAFKEQEVRLGRVVRQRNDAPRDAVVLGVSQELHNVRPPVDYQYTMQLVI
jgi:hypothetical protein